MEIKHLRENITVEQPRANPRVHKCTITCLSEQTELNIALLLVKTEISQCHSEMTDHSNILYEPLISALFIPCVCVQTLK